MLTVRHVRKRHRWTADTGSGTGQGIFWYGVAVNLPVFDILMRDSYTFMRDQNDARN
jgi:hypothetical protein